MARRAPDQPIALPSSRTLWRVALWGLFAYVAIGVVVVQLDRGTSAQLDARLSGCFQTEDARACFTPKDDGRVDLRITENGRDIELSLSAWTGRRLYTVPGYGGEPYLEVERITLFNSFGRASQEPALPRGQCRLRQSRAFEDGSRSADWRTSTGCYDAPITLQGKIRIIKDTLVLRLVAGDREVDATMKRDDAQALSSEED